MTPDKVYIQRALISVSDKSGLAELLKQLDPKTTGIEVLSTGGTAREIRKLGYTARDVKDYTGLPESPDDLVKTLHPKIHGGFLLDPNEPTHSQYMKEQGIVPIDLAVVNLYPFAQTVSIPCATVEQVRVKIDIGGPCMVRSAAKSFKRVAVIVNWQSTNLLQRDEHGVFTTLESRAALAKLAFEHTAGFDRAVDTYLSTLSANDIAGYYLGANKT